MTSRPPARRAFAASGQEVYWSYKVFDNVIQGDGVHRPGFRQALREVFIDGQRELLFRELPSLPGHLDIERLCPTGSKVEQKAPSTRANIHDAFRMESTQDGVYAVQPDIFRAVSSRCTHHEFCGSGVKPGRAKSAPIALIEMLQPLRLGD
jgi:hypothetical protein